MAHPLRSLLRWTLPATLAALLLLVPGTGHAQVFGPPSTIFGSITDANATVAENLAIEAYVGDKLCGKGKTVFTGDGAARVTVYFADVVAKEQTAGCGFDGADVKVKVGDRMASQTAKWRAGPVQLDITFGNATPAPIPTFTPAPTRTPTPRPQATVAPPPAGGGQNGQSGPSATAAQSGGSSGGQTEATAGAGTPAPGAPETGVQPTSSSGGVTAQPVAAGTPVGGDDDGFPVWGVIMIVLGGIGIAGGGAGFMLARNRRGRDGDDSTPGPPTEV